MTTFFLHIPDDPYLALKWLSAHRKTSSRITALPPEEPAVKSRMDESCPNIEWLDVLEPVSPETVAVLPVATESVPLAYYPGITRPDWVPLYPLVRSLWKAGFRDFDFWSLAGSKRIRIPFLLDHFEGCHRGKRCFVVGNGPSLNDIDMTLLKNEITLGSNRCYLGFEKWGFPFSYWGIGDWLQMEEYGGEYESRLPADLPKFFSIEYLPLLHFENPCPLRIDNRHVATPRFSDSPDSLFLGSTVTYLLLQIAAVMGCDPIILIGVDHRFEFKPGKNPPLSPFQTWKIGARARLFRSIEGTLIHRFLKTYRRVKEEMRGEKGAVSPEAEFWVSRDAIHPTHFDPRYTQGETKRFSLPSPEISEKQFDCAHRWARESGRQILNATPGSALRSFPNISFESLF